MVASAAAAAMALLLGLLAGRASGQASTAEAHQPDEDAPSEPRPHGGRAAAPHLAADEEAPHRTQTTLMASRADGRCPAGDDKDCFPDAATAATAPPEHAANMTFGERRLNTLLHGKPLTPDEENGDFGFLYARSLSLSVDDDAAANNSSPTASVKGRALRNRVFGQTWCSASSCPVAAALTLSNTTARHSSRIREGGGKLGQGEAVVACLDCSFSAASVSIVDGDAVCAAASSSNMPKGVCIAVCHWEGVDCSCAAGCSASELGSESVHSYAYQVVAGTAARDLLAFLHRLMVRVHNTAEHLNMAAQLDVPGKTRQVRANVEKRFGKEKAKAVPLLTANNGLQ